MNNKRGRPHNSSSLIRTIRMAMGLTAKELADLANVNYYVAQRIETGKIIETDRLYNIAKALDISPDILFYSMGQIPDDKIEFVKKDPLRFKELIDEACAEPWRLTKTTDYIKEVKDKMEQAKTNPEINKVLSKLKATD